MIGLAHALRRGGGRRVVAVVLRLLGDRLEHAEERARDVGDVLGEVLALLLLVCQRPLPGDLRLELQAAALDGTLDRRLHLQGGVWGCEGM